MIAARSRNSHIMTNILLEGEHINLDIQEKVSTHRANGEASSINLWLHLNCCIYSLIMQRTGQSALHLSAEEGDSATTEALLKAGANLHLKDKVWESIIYKPLLSPPRAHLVHFSFTAWLRCFYCVGLYFSLLVKNGATAMEITEQRAQSSLVSKTLPMREMMTQPSLYASQVCYSKTYQSATCLMSQIS